MKLKALTVTPCIMAPADVVELNVWERGAKPYPGLGTWRRELTTIKSGIHNKSSHTMNYRYIYAEYKYNTTITREDTNWHAVFIGYDDVVMKVHKLFNVFKCLVCCFVLIMMMLFLQDDHYDDDLLHEYDVNCNVNDVDRCVSNFVFVLNSFFSGKSGNKKLLFFFFLIKSAL